METTTTKINSIEQNQIQSVYSGQAGKCCCGCAGMYWYASSASRIAAERHGQVSDRQVARILRIIKQNADKATVGTSYISVELGARVYIAHLA